jgi:hypothetical protein
VAPDSSANLTALLNPVLTEATGLPLNSTKDVVISFLVFHRRI